MNGKRKCSVCLQELVIRRVTKSGKHQGRLFWGHREHKTNRCDVFGGWYVPPVEAPPCKKQRTTFTAFFKKQQVFSEHRIQQLAADDAVVQPAVNVTPTTGDTTSANTSVTAPTHVISGVTPTLETKVPQAHPNASVQNVLSMPAEQKETMNEDDAKVLPGTTQPNLSAHTSNDPDAAAITPGTGSQSSRQETSDSGIQTSEPRDEPSDSEGFVHVKPTKDSEAIAPKCDTKQQEQSQPSLDWDFVAAQARAQQQAMRSLQQQVTQQQQEIAKLHSTLLNMDAEMSKVLGHKRQVIDFLGGKLLSASVVLSGASNECYQLYELARNAAPESVVIELPPRDAPSMLDDTACELACAGEFDDDELFDEDAESEDVVLATKAQTKN